MNSIVYKKEYNNFSETIENFWQRAKNYQKNKVLNIVVTGKEVGLVVDGVYGGLQKYLDASEEVFDSIEIEEGFYEFRKIPRNSEKIQPKTIHHLVDCYRGSPLGSSRYLVSHEDFVPDKIKLSLSAEGREEKRKFWAMEALAEKARELGCVEIHIKTAMGADNSHGWRVGVDYPSQVRTAEFFVVWGSGTLKELNSFHEEIHEKLNFVYHVYDKTKRGRILVL